MTTNYKNSKATFKGTEYTGDDAHVEYGGEFIENDGIEEEIYNQSNNEIG